MKISYLITYHNQSETVLNTIERIHKYTPLTDQILPVWDSVNGNKETFNLVNKWHSICISEGRKDFLHNQLIPFNDNYSVHKNLVTDLSNNMANDQLPRSDFFFQIDGDEIPSITLLENLHTILNDNPNMELIYVPRINDFRGITEEHAKQWGWRLTEMEFFRPSENKRVKSLVVNVPDYQGRIYKNVPDRIKWEGRLHEKIEGHTEYSFLPAEEDYSLYHDKTIEKQIETNLKYNKNFTQQENMGHNLFERPVQIFFWNVNYGAAPKVGDILNEHKNWNTIKLHILNTFPKLQNNEKVRVLKVIENESGIPNGKEIQNWFNKTQNIPKDFTHAISLKLEF